MYVCIGAIRACVLLSIETRTQGLLAVFRISGFFGLYDNCYICWSFQAQAAAQGWFRVQGLGVKQGLGVQGLGVQGLGFRVQGPGCKPYLRVYGQVWTLGASASRLNPQGQEAAMQDRCGNPVAPLLVVVKVGVHTFRLRIRIQLFQFYAGSDPVLTCHGDVNLNGKIFGLGQTCNCARNILKHAGFELKEKKGLHKELLARRSPSSIPESPFPLT